MSTTRLSAAQIRELIGAVEERVPPVAPLYTESVGTVTEIQGVVNEYAVALTLKEDLTSNAKRWSDHNSVYSDSYLGLLLFILSIEDAELGSSFIHCGKQSDPSKYEQIIRAIAKQYIPDEKRSKYELDLIKRHCIPWLYINPEHNRDIKAMVDQIKAEKAAKKNKQNGEPADSEPVNVSAAQEAAETRMEDDLDRDLEDHWRQLSRSSFGVTPVLSFFPSLMWHNRDPQRSAPSELIGPITSANAIIDDNRFFNKPAGEDSVQAAIHPDLIAIPSAELGAEGIPKAHFTVTSICNTFGAVVGYLVRIFQMDPAWNPGKMIYKLIEENETRNKQKFFASYRDPRPQYAQYQGTQFPAHSMTWNRWVRVVDSYNYKGRDTHASAMKKQAMTRRADAYDSDFHPVRVFTLERALRRLEAVGGIVGKKEEFTDAGTKTATWPRHLQERTRSYIPNQVFWDHFEYVGLSNQFFPFVAPASPAIADLCRENMIVRKSEMRERMPKFGGLKTSNMLVQMEMETDFLMNPVNQLKPSNIMDLFAHMQETDDVLRWRAELLKHRRANLEQFSSYCMMEGNLEQLPVSGPIKACLGFLQEYQGKHEHITFEVELWDANLDFFGNAAVRETIQIFSVGKIIRPMISFKTQGLFSVYQAAKSKLLFHYLLYGEHSAGKSESGPNFVYKMCIPGTTQKIDRKTEASEQTDMAIWDLIQVEEEMDEAFVDPNVGKRQVAKVNMKKSAMTSGAVTVSICERASLPGVGDLRAQRIVHTPHKYVTMGTTNAPNVADGPIGSRFYNETIKKSNIPINQFDFEVDKRCETEFVAGWRVYQALSAIIEKAIAANVIAEPNMTIWRMVSNRMFEALNEWGVIAPERNARILVIMTNFARQMVIKNAINMTYNVKGAPRYKKCYEPADLTIIQRYMYCTTDIILFVWTALSNEIIHDEFGRILNAAFQYVTGFKDDWNDRTMTPYTIYQQDAKNDVHFKKDINPSWNPQTSVNKANKHTLDLNYMEMQGSLDEVARKVATRTSLSHNDVYGAFKRMSRMPFPPNQNGRNGYKPVPCDELELHRVAEADKVRLVGGYQTKQLNSFVSEIYTACVREIVMNMTDLDPVVTVSYLESTKMLGTALGFDWDKMDDENRLEIVFLRASIRKWKCGPADLRRILDALKKEPCDMHDVQIVFRSMQEIDMKLYEGWTVEQMLASTFLNTARIAVIRYAMHLGYIYEVGTLPKFRKPRMSTDSISFPRILTEDDIPPLSTKTFQEITVVQIYRDRVCFSPLAIALFEKNIILEAFQAAVVCGSTVPGKRLLGKLLFLFSVSPCGIFF